MESTIVAIKVICGETLRRFTAVVNEAGQLDLDMSRFREKALGLFNFPPDADLKFTYVDDDGDVVTLVDDEDLLDAMRQFLNPLRITVIFNDAKGDESYSRSNESSAPMKSTTVQQLSPILNRIVSEILQHVQEPSRGSLLKHTLELSYKAVTSISEFAELVDCFSKIVQSKKTLLSRIESGKESNVQIGTSENLLNADKKVNLGKGKGGVGPSASPVSGSVNNNDFLPRDSFLSRSLSENLPLVALHGARFACEEVKNLRKGHLGGKASNWGFDADSSYFPTTGNKAVKNSTVDSMRHSSLHSVNANLGGCGSRESPHPKLNHTTKCPIIRKTCRPPFIRSDNYNDSMSKVLHVGVSCDGCGAYPIAGPRFNSKVKEDYDLCSICFSEMGNEVDYIRMDHSVSHCCPYYSRGILDHPHLLVRTPTRLHHSFVDCMATPKQSNLDALFVVDINVLDGTILAPSMQFTKIWRIQNIGAMLWPQGTQLVWIGGDKFSDIFSVKLQISSDGLPVEMELDVAVDFTSPELPGRYVSYWRLASPSGQKFGQLVWVHIQVDSPPGINLNLPPEKSGVIGSEIVNLNVETITAKDSSPKPGSSSRASELSKQIFTVHPKEQELNLPINDTLLVGGGVSVTPESIPSTLSPVIDFPDVGPTGPSLKPSPFPPIDVTKPARGAYENDDVEQTLLRELEEMGFKEVDLNTEILRVNKYDLEKSVDDLCDVSGWDPILEELHEMGFRDTQMNKSLLEKNNGSIKRVVMDLVSAEKV